jgi:hypothetical protein
LAKVRKSWSERGSIRGPRPVSAKIRRTIPLSHGVRLAAEALQEIPVINPDALFNKNVTVGQASYRQIAPFSEWQSTREVNFGLVEISLRTAVCNVYARS